MFTMIIWLAMGNEMRYSSNNRQWSKRKKSASSGDQRRVLGVGIPHVIVDDDDGDDGVADDILIAFLI
jgi:hypothetical protein